MCKFKLSLCKHISYFVMYHNLSKVIVFYMTEINLVILHQNSLN
jgi:hypothetical protein